MSIELPGLGFDPREIGPFELLRLKWGHLKEFLARNKAWVVLLTIVLVPTSAYLALRFGISLPEIPDWVWVGVGAGLFAAPFASVVGALVAQGLYREEYELLSIQNAKIGDQKLIRVAPEKFETMTVKTQNDETRDLDYLHPVYINGEKGYELDSYNPATNTAVASWQAGATNSEMRRSKRKINAIKTDMEKEADKAHEMLANYTSILRGQVSEIAEEIVMVAQDVDLPNQQDSLHERLSETLADQDPTDDLVTGLQDDGVDDADDVQDDETDAVEMDADETTKGDRIGAIVDAADENIFDKTLRQERTNGNGGDE